MQEMLGLRCLLLIRVRLQAGVGMDDSRDRETVGKIDPRQSRVCLLMGNCRKFRQERASKSKASG